MPITNPLIKRTIGAKTEVRMRKVELSKRNVFQRPEPAPAPVTVSPPPPRPAPTRVQPERIKPGRKGYDCTPNQLCLRNGCSPLNACLLGVDGRRKYGTTDPRFTFGRNLKSGPAPKHSRPLPVPEDAALILINPQGPAKSKSTKRKRSSDDNNHPAGIIFADAAGKRIKVDIPAPSPKKSSAPVPKVPVRSLKAPASRSSKPGPSLSSKIPAASKPSAVSKAPVADSLPSKTVKKVQKAPAGWVDNFNASKPSYAAPTLSSAAKAVPVKPTTAAPPHLSLLSRLALLPKPLELQSNSSRQGGQKDSLRPPGNPTEMSAEPSSNGSESGVYRVRQGTGSFFSVKYNHKPDLRERQETININQDVATLTIKDTSNDGGEAYRYSGSSSTPTGAVLFLLDEETGEATMYPIDQSFAFNLKSTPSEADPSKLNRSYGVVSNDINDDLDLDEAPIIDVRAQALVELAREEKERGIGVQFQQELDDDTPDPNNPFDYRHYLNKRISPSSSKSGSPNDALAPISVASTPKFNGSTSLPAPRSTASKAAGSASRQTSERKTATVPKKAAPKAKSVVKKLMRQNKPKNTKGLGINISREDEERVERPPTSAPISRSQLDLSPPDTQSPPHRITLPAPTRRKPAADVEEIDLDSGIPSPNFDDDDDDGLIIEDESPKHKPKSKPITPLPGSTGPVSLSQFYKYSPLPGASHTAEDEYAEEDAEADDEVDDDLENAIMEVDDEDADADADVEEMELPPPMAQQALQRRTTAEEDDDMLSEMEDLLSAGDDDQGVELGQAQQATFAADDESEVSEEE